MKGRRVDQKRQRRPAALALISFSLAACAGSSGSERALRELLETERQAHLLTDAALLASGVADTLISVANGLVTRQARADVAAQFAQYFDGARYGAWDDEAPPLIRVSPDGRMGWVSRRVRVQRDEPVLGGGRRQVEFISAWTATYEWLDRGWRMTSVSSTFLPQPAEAERILAGARRALGGVSPSGRLSGTSARATVRGPDGESVVTVHSGRDGRARIDFRDGLSAAIGRDDSWLSQTPDAETVDLDRPMLTFLRGHEVHWMILAPETRYPALAYAGRREFEGIRALTLFATDAMGGDVRLYYSATDTLPLGLRVVDHVRGGPDPTLTYGEWETRDGIRVPTSARFRQGADVFYYRFTEIRLLDELPDSVFERPETGNPGIQE